MTEDNKRLSLMIESKLSPKKHRELRIMQINTQTPLSLCLVTKAGFQLRRGWPPSQKFDISHSEVEVSIIN
jgi:hypothetical protein